MALQTGQHSGVGRLHERCCQMLLKVSSDEELAICMNVVGGRQTIMDMFSSIGHNIYVALLRRFLLTCTISTVNTDHIDVSSSSIVVPNANSACKYLLYCLR